MTGISREFSSLMIIINGNKAHNDKKNIFNGKKIFLEVPKSLCGKSGIIEKVNCTLFWRIWLPLKIILRIIEKFLKSFDFWIGAL